jgi:hypothetical protein
LTYNDCISFWKTLTFPKICFFLLVVAAVCLFNRQLDAQIRPRIEKHHGGGGVIIDLFIIFLLIFCFQQSFKLQVNNIIYMGYLKPASKRAKTNSTHFCQTGIFFYLLIASLNCFMFLLQFVLTNLRPFLSFSKAFPASKARPVFIHRT